MNKHEPAAAEVSRSRQGHRERETHGDGSVYGITAIEQNPPADFTRRFVLADNHPARGHHRMVDAVVAYDRLGSRALGLRENRLPDEKQ